MALFNEKHSKLFSIAIKKMTVTNINKQGMRFIDSMFNVTFLYIFWMMDHVYVQTEYFWNMKNAIYI